MANVDKLRAKARFYLKNKGLDIHVSKIPEIPNQWQPFPDQHTGRWVKVGYPPEADSTGCLYNGFKGVIFSGHRHPNHSEFFHVINPNGHCILYTKTETITLKHGDGAFIEKNEPHLVEFIEDTLINIVWNPEMQNAFNIEFAIPQP